MKHACISRMNALLDGNYEVRKYRDLPRPYQLAIAFYMAIDGEAWDLFLPEETFGTGKKALGIALEQVLDRYVETFGDVRFGTATLDASRVCAAVIADPELNRDFGGDFERYRAWYRSACDVPRHGETDRWPVVLSSCDDETLQDGWHRFHGYLDSGHTSIPAIFYPTMAHIRQGESSVNTSA